MTHLRNEETREPEESSGQVPSSRMPDLRNRESEPPLEGDSPENRWQTSHPGVSAGAQRPLYEHRHGRELSCGTRRRQPGPTDFDHRRGFDGNTRQRPGPTSGVMRIGQSLADSKVSVIVVAAERLFRLGVARLLGEDERLDVIGVSEGEPELVGCAPPVPSTWSCSTST